MGNRPLPPKVYRKLVRDKIPEIIRREGKTPFISELNIAQFNDALGLKVLEEAHEFFHCWKAERTQELLKEAADLLEVMQAAVKIRGLQWDDVLREREKRCAERGAFFKRLFLHWVGEDSPVYEDFEDVPCVIIGPGESDRLVRLIKSEMARSDVAWIASAFFSPGIINVLLRDLTTFLEQGHDLRIIVSTMANMVRPEHLSHLKTVIPEIPLRVYHPPEIPYDEDPPNFHVKIYLFRRHDGTGSLLIGSSNFTQAGFFSNIEWNYFSPSEVNLPFDECSPLRKAMDAFEIYWVKYSVDISEEFLEAYRKRFQECQYQPLPKEIDPQAPIETARIEQKGYKVICSERVRPNEAQREALERLASLRRHGVRKAAVIAATGVGKTYLAAMDFKQSGSKKLLFIAHRENILNAALNSFRKTLEDPSFGALLGGGNHNHDSNGSIFAMIQTISREEHLYRFPPNAFDYIVVDEFHHAQASSYRRVLNYFQPVFLLGLTATPERMDGRDVLALCNGTVAYELRLLEAVDRGLLTPFQYFGIYDPVDYEQIPWRGTHYDLEELTAALKNDTRTAIVARNLRRYLPSFGKVKALAFCSSVAHAHYTAYTLRKEHGIEALALTGETTEDQRADAIRRLRNEADPLQVLCAVDIFNEGIDIPELTHVLFLRPTQSFTVFLQQLGRGLRRTKDKEFLVVIDFVGNFRRAHVAPLALSGFASEQEFLEVHKNSGGTKPSLPKGCFLDVDTPVRRIWDQEIRRIIQGRMSESERLKLAYLEIKDDLEGRSPSLVDCIANSRGIDPQRFVLHFNGWLRAKLYCEESLSEFEQSLLDTPGEAFLLHLEKELSPTKSYKMVVLKTLLHLKGTEWKVEEIARGFLQYYLDNPDKMPDYEELAKHPDPPAFPLKNVISKLKTMPLHFLSNTEKDYFILDKKAGIFKIKQEIIPYWTNEAFREMVSDRVEYALNRYFQGLFNKSAKAT